MVEDRPHPGVPVRDRPQGADELTGTPGLTRRFELGLAGILNELDRERRK
ncbi:hypothetical protein [Nonomuraea sp. NPDC003201]